MSLVGFVLRFKMLRGLGAGYPGNFDLELWNLARFHEKESDKPVVGELIPLRNGDWTDGTDERLSTCPSCKIKCLIG